MTTHNIPSEPEKTLSAKQLAAVPLLANGATIAATAEQVGVNEKTVDTWKKLPHFKAAVHQAENAIFDDALLLLKRNARAAVVCLVRNMDGKVSNYVQVQAASKLLEQAMDVHKMQELEERLAYLEERAKAS